MKERLDKILAGSTTLSRSQVKQLIRKGFVTVNGIPVTDPQLKADASVDEIFLREERITGKKTTWLMLNKCSGYVTSTADPQHPTVMDLLPVQYRRRKDLFPVGRLDIDTEGLLLLTDDGAAAHRLTSPSHHAQKIYHALTAGAINEVHIAAFGEGVRISREEIAKPAALRVLEVKGGVSFVEVAISEGKYHQVKRMFEAVGSRVLYLRRVCMAGVWLDLTLCPGQCRTLTDEETDAILAVR